MNRYNRPVGWRNESYRHYLAAKGVSTRKYFAVPGMYFRNAYSDAVDRKLNRRAIERMRDTKGVDLGSSHIKGPEFAIPAHDPRNYIPSRDDIAFARDSVPVGFSPADTHIVKRLPMHTDDEFEPFTGTYSPHSDVVHIGGTRNVYLRSAYPRDIWSHDNDPHSGIEKLWKRMVNEPFKTYLHEQGHGFETYGMDAYSPESIRQSFMEKVGMNYDDPDEVERANELFADSFADVLMHQRPEANESKYPKYVWSAEESARAQQWMKDNMPTIDDPSARESYENLVSPKVMAVESLSDAERAGVVPNVRTDLFFAKKRVLKKGKLVETRSGCEVRALAESLRREVSPYAARVDIAGSIRRQVPHPVDVDLVVVPKKGKEERLREVIKRRATKIDEEGPKRLGTKMRGVDVDVYFTNRDEFGAQMMTRTGPFGANIYKRNLAKRKGWKLNEYGLFDASGKRIANTEHGIYHKLGLSYRHPRSRGEPR